VGTLRKIIEATASTRVAKEIERVKVEDVNNIIKGIREGGDSISLPII
jgi:hypothetical protein